MGDLDDGWVYLYDPNDEDNYILIHCEDYNWDEDTDPVVENLAGDSRYGYNLEEIERVIYLDNVYFPNYEEFAQLKSRLKKWNADGFKIQIQRTGTDGAEITKVTFVADDSDSYDGKYFWIHTLDGSSVEKHYYIWFDMDDSGTSDPAPTWDGSAADDKGEVTPTTDDTAATVAGLVEDKITAEGWECSATDNEDGTITITNSNNGSVVDIDIGEDDMPNGWYASVTTQGGTFINIDQTTADYVYVFFVSAKNHSKIYRGESDYWQIDRINFIQYS